MTFLSKLKPDERRLVIDLVKDAGLDVSDWSNGKGGAKRASTNPKYCYEWSFVQGEIIILNLWFNDLRIENGKIIRRINLRERAPTRAQRPKEVMWKSRATKTDDAIQIAYKLQLPLRIIICDGKKRTKNDSTQKASRVTKRMLDPVSWAVVSYNIKTGDCLLERGRAPVMPDEDLEQDEPEMEGFEGQLKRRFVQHRRREKGLRELKIREALRKNNGRLVCEVPNCGFDFFQVYGEIGEGYAEVHHKLPLSQLPPEGKGTVLEDLAVVCSNCHSIIHRGGECRAMEKLIPIKRSRLR